MYLRGSEDSLRPSGYSFDSRTLSPISIRRYLDKVSFTARTAIKSESDGISSTAFLHKVILPTSTNANTLLDI